MAEVRTRGFVVRTVTLGETDRIIGLFTEELGLISVSVHGARRTHSPHLLTTQVFSFSQFELSCRKGHYSVRSSELIEPYLALQRDLDRLICAAHLAEVLVDCLRDDIAQPPLFRLWAYTMQALQEQPDPLLLTHAAQLRILAEIGLAPQVTQCVVCGRDDATLASGARFFSISSCGTVCGRPDCRNQATDAEPLSSGTSACLRHILQAPLPKLYHFSLDPAVRQAVVKLSAQYLTHQMEKAYTRLDMLQSLASPTAAAPDQTGSGA
jgi:DNA repair protein RecO (recombination protein O)